MRYIGKVISEQDVMIGKNSPNQHLIISGISGSGKSVRIADVERRIIGEGGTVIAFDINGTHEQINEDCCNWISAQKDGLDVNFLDMSLVNTGEETLSNLVEYVKKTLCPRQMRGACQLNAVRKAIHFALKNRANFGSDIEAIACGLEELDDPAAAGAYNHLCPILEGGIFRKSVKKIEGGKLNILSLRGINPDTQKRVVEIMLAVMWRQMRIAKSEGRKLTIEIDEVQNLDFGHETVLFEMLTEVRKYNANLLLSTQTLTIFNRKELAAINQAAVKLFFQQSTSDVKAVAELIEPGSKNKWISVLSRLRIGQAIAVGELEINGRTIQQPIVTKSDYPGERMGVSAVVNRRF